MKINFVSEIAKLTLQDNALDYDLLLISHSEMSKKDFKLMKSSSLQDMIVAREDRENAPIYLVLRNKLTGEYCDTSSLLLLQETLYSDKLDNLMKDLTSYETVIEKHRDELSNLKKKKANLEKDISKCVTERLELEDDIKSLERDKRKAEREFHNWKDDNLIFRFLYWLSQYL